MACTNVFSFGTKTFVAALFRTSLNLVAMQAQTKGSMQKKSIVCIHTVEYSMARDRKTARLYPTVSHNHTLCVVLTLSWTQPRITRGKYQLRNYLDHPGQWAYLPGIVLMVNFL